MSFDYILVEDTLAMHEDQIERYGGADGVRDPGLLEAALFRPQTCYCGQHTASLPIPC